ncbi:TRAP transporter small permease subunit [Agaribacterium sp. ZY112]|uniref:TRAP transporter small permease subunit n=1 Tax=Agaribacterium sp. ZY112 TaxID=3233574 RepID=UPI003524F0B3
MPNALVRLLQQLNNNINCLQSNIAALLRWLLLFMTLCVSGIVLARVFNFGSTAVQESIAYAHAFLFMLTLAYTLQQDKHVRVDIFYRRFKPEGQAWVNLIGSILFLLPFAIFITAISWHSMLQSWRIQESSLNPGGLPLIFLLKSLAPAAGFLLALQALSEVAKQLLIISLKHEQAN